MMRFGTAGVPLSTEDRDTINGIKRVSQLGLDAMEVEFVRSVYVKDEETGERIKEAARNNKVKLTVHAPYFINLNAKEGQKRGASRARIIASARAADWMGANDIVIHSAFYLGEDPSKVYGKVKEQYEKVRAEMEKEGLSHITLRPELMGKHTQFGSLDELLRLSSEVEGILPCIDFAHWEARYGEDVNNYEGFASIFDKMKDVLGSKALKKVHFHFSAVVYSEKGERYHVTFDSKEAKLKWKDMVKVWKDYGLSGTAISESPNIEVDALKAKKHYESL